MRNSLLTILVTLLMAAPASAGLVVFGDSLSDTGNLFIATGGGFPFNGVGPSGQLPQFPTPAYDGGRFTNGPTWIESLAEALGMPVTPSVIGGANFAFGGAETGAGFSVRGTPNVGTQIAAFQASSIPIDADTLFSLWAGANDFNNFQFPPQPASNVVNNVAQHISDLETLGARQFLIPNLPDLGQTPFAIANGPLVQETLTARTLEFNALLAQELDRLRNNLGIHITEVDIFTATNRVINNPGAFGFTNTTGTAFDTAAFQAAFLVDPSVDPTEFLVSNPNEYVFMDGVHPTSKLHQIWGQAAISAVPEPGSLAIWSVIGMAGIGGVWRRRAKKPADKLR